MHTTTEIRIANHAAGLTKTMERCSSARASRNQEILSQRTILQNPTESRFRVVLVGLLSMSSSPWDQTLQTLQALPPRSVNTRSLTHLELIFLLFPTLWSLHIPPTTGKSVIALDLKLCARRDRRIIQPIVTESLAWDLGTSIV